MSRSNGPAASTTIRLFSRVVSAQKLGRQREKFIGCLEICQVPGADLPARRTGNARGQFGCRCDDPIVSAVDDKRGACNAPGLSADIDSQIQLDLTCDPLRIGERPESRSTFRNASRLVRSRSSQSSNEAWLQCRLQPACRPPPGIIHVETVCQRPSPNFR